MADDRFFYGCILAMMLVFFGHPFIALFLFIWVCA